MTGPLHDVDHRARLAAAGLRRAVALEPPELSELVRASRARKVGRIAFVIAILVAVGAASFGVGSVAASESLRWFTGVILAALLIVTWSLCAHAGGHAWFVPLPALAIAVLWAVTISAHGSGAGWWLVALCAATAALGVIVGSTALSQRLRSSSVTLPSLKGASGEALTPLTPVGVVRVASETWTAESVSGFVPAGAPVHVVRVDGVRLEVWSEVGSVADDRILGKEEDQ